MGTSKDNLIQRIDELEQEKKTVKKKECLITMWVQTRIEIIKHVM